jgi:non-specific serine/threonine protein kinase
LRALSYALGAEFVNLEWIAHIYQLLADVFNDELAAFEGTAAEYLRSQNTALTVSGRVFFHLVETREEDFPFAFMATYSTKQANTVQHLPLKRALEEFDGDQAALLGLLATVSKAANDSEFITSLVESSELFSPLKFKPNEAYIFLREVPLYEDCGIICRIPNFWKRKAKSRLSLSIGAQEPALLGMQSLLAFSPKVFFGDTELSRDELEALAAEDNGLAFLKGKWVEVNQERIKQLLAALDTIEGREEMTFAEAIKLQAGIAKAAVNPDDTEVQRSPGDQKSGRQANKGRQRN